MDKRQLKDICLSPSVLRWWRLAIPLLQRHQPCQLRIGVSAGTPGADRAQSCRYGGDYYKVTPEKDPKVCDALISLRLNMCLMYYAGVDDESQLPNVDYAKAFSSYLLAHGMSQEQLNALIQALTAQ